MTNYKIVTDRIEELVALRKEFDVTIKNGKTLHKFLFNRDGIPSEIILAKFMDGDKFSEKAFVDHFLGIYDVVYSDSTGFYIYENFEYNYVWKPCGDKRIKQLIAGILEVYKINTYQRVCVCFNVLQYTVNNDNLGELLNHNRDRIVLNNGTLDISDIQNPIFEVATYYKEDYCTIRYPVEYLEQSINNSPVWNKYLQTTFEGDQSRIDLIGEMLGYCLQPSCQFQKAFLCYGKGSNGKSVLMDVIHKVWGGSQNISNVGMNELDKAFSRVQLFGKLINKCSDIDGNMLTTSYFKQIVSGDICDGEFKGKDKFFFRNTAKLIFCMNELPHSIKDKTDGFYRRLIIIPFNKQFKGSEIDYELSKKLESENELNGIFMFALHGLQRLYKQNGFTKSKLVEDALSEYKLESNPIEQFLSENYEFTKDDRYVLSKVMYQHYSEWCFDNGFKPMNNVNFGKGVKALGLNKKQKIIKDKTERIYESITSK